MLKRINILSAGLVLGGISLLLLNSCRTIPTNAVAVKPFELNRYLGKWYEIARIDFKFEKNLNNVTANYSLREDGLVKVDNKGYNYVEKAWKNSIGKAKFVGDTTEAKLKVSFFGPFYSGYNVIAIDKAYQYALVAGKNTDYLWILSREKTIPEDVKNNYLNLAKNIGYDTNRLIWVAHNQ
jgi:apolipoprotein D and lipocalin family protein